MVKMNGEYAGKLSFEEVEGGAVLRLKNCDIFFNESEVIKLANRTKMFTRNIKRKNKDIKAFYVKVDDNYWDFNYPMVREVVFARDKHEALRIARTESTLLSGYPFTALRVYRLKELDGKENETELDKNLVLWKLGWLFYDGNGDLLEGLPEYDDDLSDEDFIKWYTEVYLNGLTDYDDEDDDHFREWYTEVYLNGLTDHDDEDE